MVIGKSLRIVKFVLNNVIGELIRGLEVRHKRFLVLHERM